MPSEGGEKKSGVWWCVNCTEQVGNDAGEPNECPACGHSDWKLIVQSDDIDETEYTTQHYTHVTLIKSLAVDPVNGHPKDQIRFLPGKHPHGDDYSVMTEDSVVEIPTKAVMTMQLPEPMSKTDAIKTAKQQSIELHELASKYERQQEQNHSRKSTESRGDTEMDR